MLTLTLTLTLTRLRLGEAGWGLQLHRLAFLCALFGCFEYLDNEDVVFQSGEVGGLFFYLASDEGFQVAIGVVVGRRKFGRTEFASAFAIDKELHPVAVLLVGIAS